MSGPPYRTAFPSRRVRQPDGHFPICRSLVGPCVHGPADVSHRAPIIVVGGGLAGLSAAHTVRAMGRPVLVLEATERVGGRIRTLRDGPWLAEAGPHLFGGMSAEAMALFDELGVERCGAAAGADRRFLIHQGDLVAVPGSTSEMLGTPLLSVAGRLRLLREPFLPRGGHAEESVAGFVRRRMGKEFSMRFVEPVIAAAYGGDPTTLLARYAFAESVEFEARSGSILKGRMRASRTARREGRRPVAPWTCRGGGSDLPERLAGALGDDVRMRAEVTRVTRESEGWEVVTHDGTAYAASGVVLALSASTAGGGLLDEATSGVSLAPLAGLPLAPSRSLSLGFRRDQIRHPLDGYGIVGPLDGSAGFRSVVFASTLFPDRVPPGHALLTIQLGGVHDSDIGRSDLGQLADRVLPHLERLLGLAGSPVVVLGHDTVDLLPIPLAGHGDRLATADAAEAAMRGVVFCGSWRDGLSEGGAMRGGAAAARRVLDFTDRGV